MITSYDKEAGSVVNREREKLTTRAPTATPIARRKLGHEVQERLLTDIREGAYPVGSMLPSERELMAQFDANFLILILRCMSQQNKSGQPLTRRRFCFTGIAAHAIPGWDLQSCSF